MSSELAALTVNETLCNRMMERYSVTNKFCLKLFCSYSPWLCVLWVKDINFRLQFLLHVFNNFFLGADDSTIIAKTQEKLQDMVNIFVDTGRKYGIEINIDRSQIMRVSRSNESLQIKVNNREVHHFK